MSAVYRKFSYSLCSELLLCYNCLGKERGGGEICVRAHGGRAILPSPSSSGLESEGEC